MASNISRTARTFSAPCGSGQRSIPRCRARSAIDDARQTTVVAGDVTACVAGNAMLFGVFVPQGWKMELASIDGGEAKWAKAVEIATLAERLGYDSVWVYDHFHNVPRPAHEAVFECWTMVAAISQRTNTVRLGQMVGCASYRNPALLAKITATVDVISGGRLDWGIGAGWYEQEYRAYGYDFPRPAERIGGLADTVEIVKRMWTEPDATYRGRYYSIDGSPVRPQAGAATAPADLDRRSRRAAHAARRCPARRLLQLRRRPGDVGAQARRVAQSTATAVGRDPAEIRMTWSPEILVRGTEAEVAAAANERSLWGGDTESWRASNLVGTAEQVSEKLRSYVDIGLEGVVAWCADYPDTETLERFARTSSPTSADQRLWTCSSCTPRRHPTSRRSSTTAGKAHTS